MDGRQNRAADDKSVGIGNERYTPWEINRSYPHNASVERTKGRVITVAIDAMMFIKPIHVGDVLEVYTEIESVGRTSMRISISKPGRYRSVGATHPDL